MADQKISQLTDGGNAQAADEYVVARSGSNYRIDGASVAAAATSVGTLAGLTMTGNLTLDTDVVMSRGAANRLDLASGDSLNLVSGTYKIGATDVLSSTTLGSGVTASSLTSVGTLSSLSVTGNVTNSGLTASQAVFTNGSKVLTSNAITGTGNVVMSASPTLTGTATMATVAATTITEGGSPVIAQTDLGSADNEIPLNQYLGTLAFRDELFYPVVAGTGITAGTGTVYGGAVSIQGGTKRVNILIDLTGLNSGGTAGDIIGVNGTANPCHIGQLPSMTVLGGRMTCLEVPAGSDDDLDLYSATEGTGVEDSAITALTETQLVDAGGAWTLGLQKVFIADPTSAGYLYLVGQETGNATYTAGRFLIEVYGV